MLFCGSGATGAIDKLVRLGCIPSLDRYGCRRDPAASGRSSSSGPYEHHSNELPWRESIADVVTIREDADGRIDLDHLEDELQRHARPAAEDRQLLGRVERHRDRHRRRRGRDAAAPPRRAVAAGTTPPRARTSPIEMNPRRRCPTGTSPTRTRSSSRRTSSSAAPARRASSSPSARCSATACRRSPAAARSRSSARRDTRYHPEPSIREEAGTPAIVESIRAGLVFQLKEAVGADEIRAREERLRPARDRVVGEQPAHRDPRQHRARAARDRLARPAPSARHAAPALRRRGAQRPLRHPGARRLLLRRPVPAAPVPDRRRTVGGDGRARSRSATRARSSAGSA